jgi:hypothetical protein
MELDAKGGDEVLELADPVRGVEDVLAVVREEVLTVVREELLKSAPLNL